MTGIHTLLEKKGVAKAGKILYLALLLVFTAAFVHPDLMETANHAYLLLDGTFSGRFFEFYTDVLAHTSDLYYINAAHYNIAAYAMFAVWELPVWLFNRMFSLHVVEPVLWLWTKLLCAGLLFACAWQMKRLVTVSLGDRDTAQKAAWLFLLSPIPFLLAAFGFYDLPAIFLMLAALCCYVQDDLKGFSLLMGCSALFKIFALLLFVPLLLLARKKLVREWAPLGVLAVLPYALTSLLFWGRTGDVDDFMDLIIRRFFEFGVGFVPLLATAIAVLSVWCYLRPVPGAPAERLRAAASCGLAVFGSVLLFMIWHPQWSIFLFPFYVLAVVTQRNRRMYELLNPVLSGCILLYIYTCFPNQLEANMLIWGAGYFVRGRALLELVETPSVLTLMARYLPTTTLSMAFAAVLVCVMLFRFDIGSGMPLADRNVTEEQPLSLPRAALGFALVIAFYLCCLALSLFVINR